MERKSKKTVSMLMAIMLMILVGCGTESTERKARRNDDEEDEEKCIHEWSDATCYEPRTCRLCDETKGKALGHSTEQGECERCNEYIGDGTWYIEEREDEFGQSTGEKYIMTMGIGEFSNSATTDSELIAGLMIVRDTVLIMLLEYGEYPVNCSYGSDDYNVTMLDAKGRKHYLKGTIYEGRSAIQFSSSDDAKILKALKADGKVSFYIENADRTINNYLFTVETSNFKTVYEALN